MKASYWRASVRRSPATALANSCHRMDWRSIRAATSTWAKFRSRPGHATIRKHPHQPIFAPCRSGGSCRCIDDATFDRRKETTEMLADDDSKWRNQKFAVSHLHKDSFKAGVGLRAYNVHRDL